jgi:hypothetical protein
MTTEPRDGGGMVGAVRLDTVEASLDEVLEPAIPKLLIPEMLAV